MNTKRQTIWLVSMLSLMVVLSAYYLFTQDKDASNVLTEGSETQQTEGSTEAGTGGQIVATETDSGETGLTDEEVLGMTGLPSSAVFAQIQEQNQEQYDEQYDSLMKEIASTSDSTAEQSTEALAQLNQLEDMNEKLRGLQEQLEQTFDNAVIDPQNDRYKVVVQSEQLEKDQAVNIIDMVVKALEVPAEQVSVQFVP